MYVVLVNIQQGTNLEMFNLLRVYLTILLGSTLLNIRGDVHQSEHIELYF